MSQWSNKEILQTGLVIVAAFALYDLLSKKTESFYKRRETLSVEPMANMAPETIREIQTRVNEVRANVQNTPLAEAIARSAKSVGLTPEDAALALERTDNALVDIGKALSAAPTLDDQTVLALGANAVLADSVIGSSRAGLLTQIVEDRPLRLTSPGDFVAPRSSGDITRFISMVPPATM